ncbi:MAG: phage virion morphogenesis protein [Novosphingobium sp.]|nr:phage virion morphogenesis protein [Novosphingobium sp.]
MSDDLAELERIAGALLRSLSAAEQRGLMRRMGRDLAASQRRRIAAQQQPDGSAFEARRERTPAQPGRGPACFLYPAGGGGEPRRVLMKSFTWGSGHMLTGFDIEAGAIRSFERDKIVKWLPVPEEHRGGSAARKRPVRIRRRAMFRRLATARYLRSGVDDQGVWVGFTGKVAQIASVHQHGLRDKPSLRAKAVLYPRRELLGFTVSDQETMLDLLYAHVSRN